MRPISGLLSLLCALLVACSDPIWPEQPTSTTGPGASPLPTPTLAAGLHDTRVAGSDTPIPTLPPRPDSGWEQLHPGLERRILHLFDDDGEVVDQIYLLRIDPAGYQFQVGYHPGQPQSLLSWQRETGALVVVNGGYFTEAFEATALVISEGVAAGVSYGDFAGMFTVTAAGPEVRWLQQQPYNPDEPILAALQSFPLLVKPGGELGFPEETGQAARRTVIAQDNAGQILFLVTSGRYFTLHELALFLVTSDLNLQVALNLDGGPSSGLVLAEPEESVAPQAIVPAVIVVRPNP